MHRQQERFIIFRTLLSICDVGNEGFGDVQSVSCPKLNAISLARALRDRTKYNFQTVLFLLTCEWDWGKSFTPSRVCQWDRLVYERAEVNRSATEFTTVAKPLGVEQWKHPEPHDY
jgi:hypothetical protein